MSIELTDEIQNIIEQAMKTGLYGKPEDVVSAALRSLAEDLDDLNSIAERASEPRIPLSVIEAEGVLKACWPRCPCAGSSLSS
jgi:Arc/MetJ-type ribon-helix-helix transcriptional regulator